MALRREPSQPKPPPWGDVAIVDYEKLIQPIFDRHCVRCHGAKDPKKGLDLTASRDPYGFMQSYRSLFGIKRDVPTPLGEGYPRGLRRDAEPAAGRGRALRSGQAAHLQARRPALPVEPHERAGGHRSPSSSARTAAGWCSRCLDGEAHRKDVALSRDEWETLVTWVDANAPYYSTYFQYFDSSGKLLPRADAGAHRAGPAV